MSTAWARSSSRQSGARIWAAWCSWLPDGPAASVRGQLVARVEHPRVAGRRSLRPPGTRRCAQGAVGRVRASVRPRGRGGEEPAAGRRLTLGGPVRVLAVLAPRSPTPLARAQAGCRYTSAHGALHTHPDRSSLCHSGRPPPPAPRTVLACFSAYPLTASLQHRTLANRLTSGSSSWDL